MRRFLILLGVCAPGWLLGLLLPAAAPAAVDMYLQVDGLQGESTNDKYKDTIDVLAYSWGASNQNGTKPAFQDFSVTKYIDQSSPAILNDVATGRLHATAKLTVVKAGDNPVPYLRYCFTGVRFDSVSHGGSGGEDRFTENVSFSYNTIVEAYQRQSVGGALGPTVFGGWDVINKLLYGQQGPCS